MALFPLSKASILPENLLNDHQGNVYKKTIKWNEVPRPWFLWSLMIHVQSVSRESSASPHTGWHIFCISLGNCITSPTTSGGFDSAFFASGSNMKHCASFDADSGLTALLSTLHGYCLCRFPVGPFPLIWLKTFLNLGGIDKLPEEVLSTLHCSTYGILSIIHWSFRRT